MILLIGFELTFKEECTENWNCSDWSECINEINTRTCNDLNNCGTTLTKPILTKTCDSGEIECTKDEDCWWDSMTPPYCKENQVCFGGTSDSCVNPGKNNSYCLHTHSETCTPCAYECQNNRCINQSSNLSLTKECEEVGFVDKLNDKYCSTEYKWENRKAQNSICNEDYECKYGCLEGKCLGKFSPGPEPIKWKFWLFVIIVVIIIIIILFIFIKRKSKP